ncbi:MAG TPA: hypothetical protein VGU20_26035 [Stellaceae bacterium]|nr:hypothetical protein [Stellaceae bacterium]
MDIYAIGVSIALKNGISPVLQVISRDLLGLKTKISDIENQFSRWGVAVGGAAAVLSGTAIFGALGAIAKKGEDLLDQQDKLMRANLSLNEVLELQKKYYQEIAAAVPTSTVSEYLKTFNELRTVVGAARAEDIAPWSMKVQSLIANATGRSAEGEAYKLWRAIEMTGRSVSDVPGSQKLADAFVKDIIGAGGKLDANTYQTMARRAGVAWANADPKFLAGPMSVVAADLGGQTAGTALMSAYMFLTGATTLSKQQAQVLEKAGLLDMSKVTRTGFGGGTYQLAPGAIIGSDKYLGAGHFDLYGWTQNVLNPALQGLSQGDRATFDSLLAKVGRNRNVMRMLDMFSDPGFVAQINKDLEIWDQAHSVDQSYSEANQRNPKFITQAFADQWSTMLSSIGAPLMQAALPVMKSFTSMFTSIGAIANAHPTALKIIGEGLAALAAGLVVLGGVAVIGAVATFVPVAAAIGGAIAGLAAALGTLAAINWQSITAMFAGIATAIENFLAKLGGLLSHFSLGGGVTDVPGVGAVPGAGPAPGLLHKESWKVIPSRTHQPVQITTALNIDGRRLAEEVSNQLASLFTFPTQAPYPDGRRGWWSPQMETSRA